MRNVWMILLSFALAPACGRSDSDENKHAGPAADGGTAGYEALVVQSVAAYDDVLRMECECVAESGGVASVEDCVAPSASGPSWVPCGTMALEANDSPEVQEIARCFAQELARRSQCLASMACDSPERSQCDSHGLSCAGDTPQIIVKLIEACPDLGLLSRLSAE